MYVHSHLMGMFYRTIRMIENGIKPVYVFDGKPPDMKSGEVCKNLDTDTSTLYYINIVNSLKIGTTVCIFLLFL